MNSICDQQSVTSNWQFNYKASGWHWMLKIMWAHWKILHLERQTTGSPCHRHLISQPSSELISIWICIVFWPDQIYLKPVPPNKWHSSPTFESEKPTKCDYTGQGPGHRRRRSGTEGPGTCQMSSCFWHCPGSWMHWPEIRLLSLCLFAACVLLSITRVSGICWGDYKTQIWTARCGMKWWQKDKAGNNWN